MCFKSKSSVRLSLVRPNFRVRVRPNRSDFWNVTINELNRTVRHNIAAEPDLTVRKNFATEPNRTVRHLNQTLNQRVRRTRSKGTRFWTRSFFLRNEAGTAASQIRDPLASRFCDIFSKFFTNHTNFLEKNWDRNDCLKFTKGTRQERVLQKWGTSNSLP